MFDEKKSPFLEAGVPAGILQKIPSSMQWQQKHASATDDDLDGVHLLHCQGNWTQAETNPKLLEELLDKEIEAGWVSPFHGDADAASAHWPQGTAIGKLNIVAADGKDPRLVLDSTVCNANTLCKVPERVSLPTALDVQRTFQHHDPFGAFAGLSLDFKAARKSVKVSAHEHGCLLFKVQQRIYHYIVCHFGAKFSAYWWQRVGSQITRVLHALLSKFSHKAWLCVDDLLAVLARASWEDQVILITCLLSALHAPISWCKAQLGNSITWCGWTFHLDLDSLHLVQSKLDKLRDQLYQCGPRAPASTSGHT